MRLSEKIIKIREENNLTQDEMAERIFVTRQAISKCSCTVKKQATENNR